MIDPIPYHVHLARWIHRSKSNEEFMDRFAQAKGLCKSVREYFALKSEVLAICYGKPVGSGLNAKHGTYKVYQQIKVYDEIACRVKPRFGAL